MLVSPKTYVPTPRYRPRNPDSLYVLEKQSVIPLYKICSMGIVTALACAFAEPTTCTAEFSMSLLMFFFFLTRGETSTYLISELGPDKVKRVSEENRSATSE